ncbi:MAG: RNA polymerase sigma factor [Chloroflexota bacterium]
MFTKKPNKEINESDIAEAIVQLKAGSAEAFHLLYRQYNQKVYRFCLRMLGDEAAAKDAFQETFIKVYENRKNFRGENFAAWLFTIARHTCLNHIRARKKHDTFDEIYHGSMKAPSESDVGMKQYIDKAVSMLPEALREALILREYEEYSYQEIADILGIELSLAKVRVFRARTLLRKLLKPLVREINES